MNTFRLNFQQTIMAEKRHEPETNIMTMAIRILAALAILFAGTGAPGAEPSADTLASATEAVHNIEIRVIFGGETGFRGHAPRELRDMGETLTGRFDYASYELSNRMRLGLMDGEEARALLFPNHYLRLIPKGGAADGLRVVAEIYEIGPNRGEDWFMTTGDIEVAGIRREGELRTDRELPVLASAMVLNGREWETIGGIPVRVNAAGEAAAYRSTGTPGFREGPAGRRKFLILGMKIEGRDG